jgi:hypothetical protein
MVDFGTAGGSIIGAANPEIFQGDSALLQLIANMPSKLQDMSTARAQRQQALMEMALAPVKMKQQQAAIEAENARTEAIKLKYMNQLNFQREMSGLPPLDVSNLTGGAMPMASGGSSGGGSQNPLEQMINPVSDSTYSSDESGLVPVVDLGDMGEDTILQSTPIQQLIQPQDEVARKVAIAKKYGQPTTDIISEANYNVSKQRLGLEQVKSSPDYLQTKERIQEGEKSRRTYLDKIYDETDKSIAGQEHVKILKSELDSMKDEAIKTGVAAPAVVILNSLSKQFDLGIPTLDSGSNMEVVEASANKIAIPLAKQLGSVNPTDFDFKQIKATVASAGKSMQGNYALVDIMEQSTKRAEKLQQLLTQAEQDNLSAADIRIKVREFNSQQHIFPPKSLPKDMKKLKIGERYVSDKGVYIWDGKAFVSPDEGGAPELQAASPANTGGLTVKVPRSYGEDRTTGLPPEAYRNSPDKGFEADKTTGFGLQDRPSMPKNMQFTPRKPRTY